MPLWFKVLIHNSCRICNNFKHIELLPTIFIEQNCRMYPFYTVPDGTSTTFMRWVVDDFLTIRSFSSKSYLLDPKDYFNYILC